MFSWIKKKLKKLKRWIFHTSPNQSIPINSGYSTQPQWVNKTFYNNLDFKNSLVFILDQLAALKPVDITKYCPTYWDMTKAQKMGFWEFFLSCVAYLESGLNPKSTYQESFRDRHGKHVISTGLFQVSVESVNGYFKEKYTQKQLLNPAVNMKVAGLIAIHWIKKDGVIGIGKKGMARYWSVLRDGSKKKWIKKKCFTKYEKKGAAQNE